MGWAIFPLLGLLLSFYIFQVHAITSFAYRIASSERTVLEQKEANKNLKLSSPAGNSFANLASLAERYNFEKVQNISYLQLLEGPFARKEIAHE